MEYLSPVINHVHNKLNVSITIRLSNGRFALPAGTTTVLDFDIMSLANKSERLDLFNSVSAGYIAVDIMVLKDGEYVKAGEYSAYRPEINTTTVKHKAVATTSTTERAKAMGITVTDIPHKDKSINEVPEDTTVVEAKKTEDTDVVKPYVKPTEKVTVKNTEKVEETTALKSVKNNAKKDK